MELVKYRDAGMANCTYFWINDQRHHVSPFFDSQHDAEKWLEEYVKTLPKKTLDK